MTTLRCPKCDNKYTPTGREKDVRCNGGTHPLTGKPVHVDVDMVEDEERDDE